MRQPPRKLPAGLTERELQVLLALVLGGSNRQIAEGLGISAKTVGHHVQHVYKKAGVRSRAAATHWAFEHDLVRTGRLDVDCCIVFEIKDGRFIDGREYFFDLHAWDEFWS